MFGSTLKSTLQKTAKRLPQRLGDRYLLLIVLDGLLKSFNIDMINHIKKVLTSLAAICTVSIPIALWSTLESRYKLQNSPPVWSPDGQTLLFSATPFLGEIEIYQIKVDRTKLKRLTNLPNRSSYFPIFSPDGQKIFFLAADNQPLPEANRYVMSSDGSNPTFISNESWQKLSPDGKNFVNQRPDGKKIAFLPKGIFLTDTDGLNKTYLSGNGEEYSPSWSPNHQPILYAKGRTGNSDDGSSPTFWVMNSDTLGKPRKLPSSGWDYQATWSPNGKQVLYHNSNKQNKNIVQSVQSIWVVNADGTSKPRKLATGYNAVWSPDSQRIAFICPVGNNPNSICLMNADGSNLKVLKQDSWVQDVVWSPDGKKFAFLKLGRDNPSLYVMNVDGSGLQRLTLNEK